MRPDPWWLATCPDTPADLYGPDQWPGIEDPA